MKNTLGDLNNHLFEQLERLNSDEMTEEQFNNELARAKIVTGVATQIISNANIILRAKQLQADMIGIEKEDIPKMLEG